MVRTELQAAEGLGLDQYGIDTSRVFRNLGPAKLYEFSLCQSDAQLAYGGALVVATGVHTGRAPKDKFIVDEPSCHDKIWWGDVNAAMSEACFEALYAKISAHIEGRPAFVQDVFAGAEPNFRLPVRVITESPWHSLF
ncbi:MAG: phosphoenolpyruvate carboxykinase (ATP), partial [Kiloniellaceae bacterium]